MTVVDPDLLPQRWVHSHEEDAPGMLVFRPGSWRFPPSRGRRAIALEPGGTLAGSTPGPDDRTVKSVGHWQLLPGDVLELAPDGKTVSRLQILDVSADRLIFKR